MKVRHGVVVLLTFFLGLLVGAVWASHVGNADNLAAPGSSRTQQQNLQQQDPASRAKKLKDDSMYEYNATVVKIVDGDTIDVDVDLGMRIHRQVRLRFAGINAPEMSTQAGKESKKYLETILAVGDQVRIKTYQDPSIYDRYTAWITTGNTIASSVNEEMVQSGHAIADNYKDH
jgi:micrococcal nuclease